jgi:hypothetical protein
VAARSLGANMFLVQIHSNVVSYVIFLSRQLLVKPAYEASDAIALDPCALSGRELWCACHELQRMHVTPHGTSCRAVPRQLASLTVRSSLAIKVKARRRVRDN